MTLILPHGGDKKVIPGIEICKKRVRAACVCSGTGQCPMHLQQSSQWGRGEEWA